jgi:hypothetical protein
MDVPTELQYLSVPCGTEVTVPVPRWEPIRRGRRHPLIAGERDDEGDEYAEYEGEGEE